ncbi:hypothetical protein TNCT_118721 [Trichonephila clavata]|uniref:Uncharacterized protein n=1 Tax=Trichonephila clavata TaxID=2740835 RepID=A0A8X6KUC6_TRICU|nr:hypothetical protein TNCT_118721 [Trichonephila clavata]
MAPPVCEIRVPMIFMKERFLWYSSAEGCKNKCRQSLLARQRSKVQHQVHSSLGMFPLVVEKFAHVYRDAVGYLVSPHPNSDLLMCVDRFL